MGIGLRVAIAGSFREALEAEERRLGVALAGAASRAGEVLKERWRGAVRAAGLGEAVARAIRADTYPAAFKVRGRAVTLNPATLVYSKTPHILLGHAGETIGPAGARYLAIPTEFTPLTRGGRGRRGPMPLAEFLSTFGQRSLARIPLDGDRVALVARTGFGRSRSTTRTRGLGRRLGGRSRRGEEQLLMYVLVRQVRLRRRLDPDAMLDEARILWPRLLAEAIAREFGANAAAGTDGAGDVTRFAAAAGRGRA